MRLNGFRAHPVGICSMGICMVAFVFLMLGACTPAGDTGVRTRTVVPSPIRHLVRKVRTRLHEGLNPSALSRPHAWHVDRRGRIDLVVLVRPNRLGPVTRWVVRQHGRLIAVIHSAHEFEAWIPARIVSLLAGKSTVVSIRFPHYALVRR